jgi:hypothetical protein
MSSWFEEGQDCKSASGSKIKLNFFCPAGSEATRTARWCFCSVLRQAQAAADHQRVQLQDDEEKRRDDGRPARTPDEREDRDATGTHGFVNGL